MYKLLFDAVLQFIEYPTGEELSMSLAPEELPEYEAARAREYPEVVTPMFLGRYVERAEQIEAREKRLTGMLLHRGNIQLLFLPDNGINIYLLYHTTTIHTIY